MDLLLQLYSVEMVKRKGKLQYHRIQYHHICCKRSHGFHLFRHGVTPMDSSEPTYVGATIFRDRKSFDSWTASSARANIVTRRVPETVYYEGTLVIRSGA
jgi:hypothetical protein